MEYEGLPWTLFYRAGEIIRELRKGLEYEAGKGAEVDRWDEEALSRLGDEGCPNHPTRPHVDEYCGVGGRLLLVGSPIF